MIELDNICKIYNQETLALHDVSFKLPNKGLVCIVGKSGCGKTTLLNILSGAIKPSSGAYFIEGKDTKDFTDKDWGQVRTNYFGYVFQNYNLLDSNTVYENIKIATLNLDYEVSDEKINEVLNKLDIYDIKDKKVNTLSGGQCQRVSIARALIKDVKVLLADEPTGALDFENGSTVFEVLKEISKERLVVVVTHDLEFASKYGDYFIKLHYGKIIENTIDKTDEKIELGSTSKFSFNRINELKKIILKDNIKKNIFSIIIYSIFTMILCLTLHISSFTPDSFIHNSIKKYDVKYSYVSAMENSLSAYYSPDIMKLDFGNRDVKKVYIRSIFTNMNQLFGHNIDDNLLDKVIVDERLNDNEIVITDYFLNILKDRNIISFDKYNDCIGKTIEIYSVNLTIKDFEITNYEDKKIVYLDTKSKKVIMNANTLKKLICNINPHYNKQNEYEYYREDSLKHLQYFGDINLGEDDIALNDALVWTYFDCYEEFQQDLEQAAMKYIGKKVNIDGKEFNLKAISLQEGLCVTYSNEYFDKIYNYEDIDLDGIYYSFTYLVECNDWNNYCMVNNLVLSNKLYLVNEYSVEMNDVVNHVNGIFKNSALIITCLLAVTLVVFIFYSTKIYLKNNKKTIGVLEILGYNNKEIQVCYYYSNLIITAIELLIGLLLGLLSIYLFNIYGYSTVGIDILSPNIGKFAIVGLGIIIISYGSLFIMLKKLSKYDVVKLLKIE